MKIATCKYCQNCNKNTPLELFGVCLKRNELIALVDYCNHFKPIDDSVSYQIPTELVQGKVYKSKSR